MRFRVLFLLLLAATGSSSMPARAAAPDVIVNDWNASEGVIDLAFSPKAIMRAPGSTITWRNDDFQNRFIETVTAYYGATFASTALTPGQTFSAVYPGGTVLYRSVYHSTLDYSVSPPACSGVCGAIHDSTQDLVPPSVTITTPNGFVFTGGVRIDGVASDNRAVKTVAVTLRPVAEIPMVLTGKSAVAQCAGCDGPSVVWKVFYDPGVAARVPVLTIPPGQYRVEAVATDPHGNSAMATPIVVYVLQ